MTHGKIELQDILRDHIGEYEQVHSLSFEQRKVVSALIACRTAALGAHITTCEECGAVEISYNSCNNRHCNKCQSLSKEKWLEARTNELLEVGYFHTVFTVPCELNPIFYHNKKLMYSLLFKATSETVLELSAAENHLNGQPGITSIMHTWGQNLEYHPHIHMVIPGGVITPDSKWRKTSDKYFLPIKALRHKFRGKFLSHLKKHYRDLSFFGDDKYLENPAMFEDFLSSLYKKEWVVYSKAPFKSSSKLLDYLGRYTHRVAISNNRIISCENGKVSFKWRDRRDENKEKVMTLSVVEFIRRFLMHVLPNGFTKIRHYGFLGNNQKKTRLKLAQKLVNKNLSFGECSKLTTREIMLRVTGIDIDKCQKCGGRLIHTVTRASPQCQTTGQRNIDISNIRMQKAA